MDIYLGASFVFTFISLGKLVLLKYLRRQWQIKHANDEMSWSQQMNAAEIGELSRKAQKAIRNRRKTSFKVDGTCYFQCISCFHISTQLLLPICYGGFLAAALIFMPMLQNHKNLCA